MGERGESERILTLHRNPIEILFMGEWCSAGSEQDYQGNVKGIFYRIYCPVNMWI